MKRITAILLAVLMVLSLAACAGETGTAGGAEPPQNSTAATQTPDETKVPSEMGNESQRPSETPDTAPDGAASEPRQEPTGSKILVAYFSATNNTEGVAQKLADGLGADLYEIVPEQPYTDEDLDYNSDCRANREQNDSTARPAISGTVDNMEQYDVVFLGYPIWWGEAPKIMSTFIESYDFSGKTIIPFCTSGSSRFGDSDSALRSAASGATWLDGHRFSAGASAEDVMAWADGLGIK